MSSCLLLTVNDLGKENMCVSVFKERDLTVNSDEGHTVVCCTVFFTPSFSIDLKSFFWGKLLEPWECGEGLVTH